MYMITKIAKINNLSGRVLSDLHILKAMHMLYTYLLS